MSEALDEFLEGGKESWCFTFGFGQAYPNCYIIIWGVDGGDARRIMFERFGAKWSMQYKTPEDAGKDEWNLKEIYWEDVKDEAEARMAAQRRG